MASLTNLERATRLINTLTSSGADHKTSVELLATELDGLEKRAFNMACQKAIKIAEEKIGHTIKEPIPGHLVVARIKSMML